MYVLGINPGPCTAGFDALERHGHKLVYIVSGTIKSSGSADLSSRLKTLHNGVSELVDTYRPNCVSIEKAFVNVNPQSTLLPGQTCGTMICDLTSDNLPVLKYTALQLEQAAVDYGHVDKDQVQEMVVCLLNLEGKPDADASDALGVTIYHAYGGETLAVMTGLAPRLTQKGLHVWRGRFVG